MNFVRKIREKVSMSFGRISKSFYETIIRIIVNPVSISIITTVTAFIFFTTIQITFEQILTLEDKQIIERFTEWLGIPYSILISMVLIRAWERADSVISSLAKEAYAVSTLYEKAQSIQSSTKIKQRILARIISYVMHIEQNYSREHKNILYKSEGDQIIVEIGDEIKRGNISASRSSYSELSKDLDELRDARKDRFFVSKPLPVTVWLLLLSTSLLWLFTFISVRFQNSIIGYSLIGGIIFIVVTTIITIVFFNEPTRLEWNDISGSWTRLKMRISTADKET